MKAKNVRKPGPQTQAIHAGEPLRHGVGASIGGDICRTSNFTFSSIAEMKRWAAGKSKAYIYTRYGNPTLTVAEEKIAALEGLCASDRDSCPGEVDGSDQSRVGDTVDYVARAGIGAWCSPSQRRSSSALPCTWERRGCRS